MNKKALSILVIIFFSIQALLGQVKKQNEYTSPSSDFLMFQFQNQLWGDAPDSIKVKNYNPSLSVYVNKDFPIKTSNFSVALGLGMSYNNVYFNDQIIDLRDSSSAARFEVEDKSYKKFKFATWYIEAPIELRYFQNKLNKNKGMKAAIGLKVGNLLNEYTKGIYTDNGIKNKEIIKSKRYLEPWRVQATARVGWGNFSLMASYQFSSIFKQNLGPQIHPISFGICISGL